MPEYNDTLDDFNLKWSNTFALYKNELHYVYAAEVNENPGARDDERYFVTLENAQQKRQIYYNFDLSCLTSILVDSQYFNGVDLTQPSIPKKIVACMHIARNAKRQNKRSLSSENSTILNPYYTIITLGQSRWPAQYKWTSEMVTRLLEQTFPAYTDALALCHQHLMVAISPNFAVALSNFSSNRYLIASQFGWIGEATKTALYIHHPGSRQEVCDFVHRNHLPLQVLNAP